MTDLPELSSACLFWKWQFFPNSCQSSMVDITRDFQFLKLAKLPIWLVIIITQFFGDVKPFFHHTQNKTIPIILSIQD